MVGQGRPEKKLRVIMFSARSYEVTAFKNEIISQSSKYDGLEIVFVSTRLDLDTASLADGAKAICLFATDHVDSHLMQTLREYGIRLIALRYAGYGNILVDQAKKCGIIVAKTPAHAPTSIAEYTVTLMLTLNRKVHIANSRVRDGNFDTQGLVGFDVSDRTVGIIGTGKVGCIVARILRGFGCRILAYDMVHSQDVKAYGGRYVSLKYLFQKSDIICLHAPLVPGTHHMINSETLSWCKRGVHIINTSRGGLVNVQAVIDALHNGQVGGIAMDVYEGENTIFFRDNTNEPVDRNFQLLKSLPNVVITGHQAALTTNALAYVAKATLNTLLQFQNGEEIEYAIKQTVRNPNSSHGSNATSSDR